jgi:hypothetical protein
MPASNSARTGAPRGAQSLSIGGSKPSDSRAASTAMPTAERVVHQQIAPSSEASRKRKRRSGKKTL